VNSQDKSDSDKPKGNKNDSDFDETFSDHPALPVTGKKDRTTEPMQSPTSRLPFNEFMMDREIGSGTVVGSLGSGGMGDVYKIWNESLGVHRAIKIMQRCNEARQAKRFEREIKISAQFDHPHIVHIHTTGLWKGYRYLEMEFIDGASLDAWINKRGNFPPCVCTAIGICAARALTYAHNHTYTLEGKICTGVVHRDIKPANMMLSKDGKLKIMDFGIARPITEELATLTTGIVGSWPYLPPEQLDGCSVDHRADLYALGAVFYELLTGRVAFPFENQKTFYTNKTRGVYKRISDDGVVVHAELEKLITKCLEVKPDARYQTAEELEKALVRIHNDLCDRSPESILGMFVREEHIPLDPGRKQKNGSIDKPLWKKPGMLLAAGIAFALVVSVLFVLSRTTPQVPKAVVPQTGTTIDTPAATSVIAPPPRDTAVTVPLQAPQPPPPKDAPSEVSIAQPPKQAREPIVPKDRDWAVTASKSLERGHITEAIKSAEKIVPKNDSLNARIAEKCLDLRDLANAKKILSITTGGDLFAEVLKARVLLQENHCLEALTRLEAGFKLQTRFPAQWVQADARYFKAKALNCLWIQNKAEYREKALDAWRDVWKIYKGDGANPRYKEAAQASSLIGKEQE
jgi:serine/threonine protein kinase